MERDCSNTWYEPKIYIYILSQTCVGKFKQKIIISSDNDFGKIKTKINKKVNRLIVLYRKCINELNGLKFNLFWKMPFQWKLINVSVLFN